MGKRDVDDRFKKFGTVSFTKISKVNDFIGYLEDGKVMSTTCKGCGAVFFPPRADCSQCLSSDMEWAEVTGQGDLISFSKLQYGPVGFEDDLPYTIAVADFNDLKVFGRISKELSDDEIQVGMKVTVAPLALGGDRILYEFKKA
jgi:uncharacterized OB-fold protein